MDVDGIMNKHLLDFMFRETMSPFKYGQIDSNIPKEYFNGSEFDIKYLAIPVEDIYIFDYRIGTPNIREHIYTDKNERFFRFFIHPESEELYKDMIVKYGIAGIYRAKATASARTVLAWNPKAPASEPVFIKLSLNRRQSGIGRVVSDWEVRRSVLVSYLASLIPPEDSDKYCISIITEFAGGYIGKELAAGAYIDNKQHTVFQHGLIFRDTQFFKQFPYHDFYPLFALFSECKNNEPLIVEWWREECVTRKIDFEQFLCECIVKPLVRAIGYLVFEQGIIPDTHGQNLIAVVNSKSRRIKHIFIRDVGSMKVNFLLRLVKTHSVDSLMTHNIIYDFKYRKANEISGKPFFYWIFNRIFGNKHGVENILLKYVPTYNVMIIHEEIQIQLKKTLDEHLPENKYSEPNSLNIISIQHRLEHYIRTHKPKFTFLYYVPNQVNFNSQFEQGQSIQLPSNWFKNRKIFDNGYLYTEYGVIHPTVSNKVFLTFLPQVNYSNNKPTYYQVEVTIDQLFIETGAVSTIYRIGKKEINRRMRKPIPVFKAGIGSKYRYHVIAEYTRLQRSIKQGFRFILVRVINDITDMSSNIQKRILQQAYLDSSLLK